MNIKTYDMYGPLIKLGPIKSPYSIRDALDGDFIEGQLDTIISPSGKVIIKRNTSKSVLTDTSDGVQ